MDSSAARTNLSSSSVNINTNRLVGTGQFRLAYEGTYIGGNRNNQEAVCKCFHARYAHIENEFFADDKRVIERALLFAEDWNNMCDKGKEILITYGSVMRMGGKKYLVEPLIRYFTKFTSNNGWIADVDDEGWAVLAMEAFSHYSYHRSGGQMIVCDLQGRYRHDPYSNKKRRFELTDPAICSRRRTYGPTDLGEKGIESFFSHHRCNQFCNLDGNWARPRYTRTWFASNSRTSMVASSQAHLLNAQSTARFNSNLQPIYDYDDSDSDESW